MAVVRLDAVNSRSLTSGHSSGGNENVFEQLTNVISNSSAAFSKLSHPMKRVGLFRRRFFAQEFEERDESTKRGIIRKRRRLLYSSSLHMDYIAVDDLSLTYI